MSESKEDIEANNPLVSRLTEKELNELKLKQELEDKQWKSCCFDLHKESTLFFGKLLISILTIALCSYQLIRNIDSNSQALYSSLLSSVLTFWLSKKN